MSISLNRLIKVLPSVIKAAGNAIDLNGVILSDNDYLPVGTALPFASSDTVLAKFGSNSDEHKAAKIYFQGVNNATTTPSKLFFARYSANSSAAALIGNNLKLTLADLKKIKGEMTLSVNGEEQTVEVDLSSAASFDSAAEIIGGELSGAEIEYNEITKQFKIYCLTGSVKPEDSSIGFASGLVADALALSMESGAYISEGNAGMTADSFFASLLSKTANWYSFTTLFEATDAQHIDFADWVNAQEARFNYVGWTSSGTALVSGSAETILYKINEANYANVTPVYSLSYDKPVNVLGYYASLDFNRVNGRVPLHYRSLDGLTPDVSSNADYDALNDNGYNFYGGYAANIDSYAMWQPGRVTGDFMWADTHAAQAWLNANIQLTILNTFMSNLGIPYNPAGKEMLASPLVTPLEQFKSWGGCVTGTDLDNSQILQIKQLLGYDASSALTAKGYVIYIGKFTSTSRANRTTPPCYVLYADGGSFRTITLNSVEVQ
ncbi:uncharacterized protein DUF3383 [Orbus hercynius]|uniref:Uncharacterized protein DUF3383 n=1 Tax=Orbus hercynius TaxID=593135 RepID=A0A495RIU4_9GAMM|nr:DUF3383 domain-containing protein [Orbus hercynius]RKS87331.1 uncharacterized protein DUF3383 [Orbus hercynius]